MLWFVQGVFGLSPLKIDSTFKSVSHVFKLLLIVYFGVQNYYKISNSVTVFSIWDDVFKGWGVTLCSKIQNQ